MPIESAEKMTLSLDISESELDYMLEKEWLLTNSRGSYSSGTVLGCNTRRYHGLLVAALHPPVERYVTLSNMLETIEYQEETVEISSFEFSDRLHPLGYKRLKKFRRGCGVHFGYKWKNINIEKSIYLDHDRDELLIRYRFEGVKGPLHFKVIPMIALRDFHSMQSSSATFQTDREGSIISVRVLDPNGPAVHLCAPQFQFDSGADWWYAMHYRGETLRGQHDYEDVWAMGVFHTTIEKDGELALVVHATRAMESPKDLDFDINQWVTKQNMRLDGLFKIAQVSDETSRDLVRAADQFVVRRQIQSGKASTSILAGYHWFADWGRDTFIALPGLLLDTGRHTEALEVLLTFGSVLDQGQIPNRFDDYGGAPHYNSIDASLWFINAAWSYLNHTGDQEQYHQHLRPMIETIVKHYRDGTRDGIRADEDGLITGGSHETQLTWMDAKCNGVAFTPRYGKAVEINALWYSALRILAESSASEKEQKHWLDLANQVKSSFIQVFWNVEGQYLNDCVYPDGGIDCGIRPNQIFAVSLPFSCLKQTQQKGVLQCVEQHLLTPYGLRSLSPQDNRYRGWYGGDQFQRDSAYHQGTVWAFLIGPFIEAYLKVHKHSKRSLANASGFIQPLIEHVMREGCLGSISEIFDGDFPHCPKGCVAQAWSVAGLLRAYRMIYGI